jgi:hypothetical protein
LGGRRVWDDDMRSTAWLIGLILSASPALAQAPAERTLFDSWNAGLCGLTDTAFIDIYAPSHVTRIEVMFNWDQGERETSFTLAKADGAQLAGGTLTRSSNCDPAAPGWCGAQAAVALDLPTATYKVRTGREGICQNPDSQGSGFIRVFGTAPPAAL